MSAEPLASDSSSFWNQNNYDFEEYGLHDNFPEWFTSYGIYDTSSALWTPESLLDGDVNAPDEHNKVAVSAPGAPKLSFTSASPDAHHNVISDDDSRKYQDVVPEFIINQCGTSF